jgi:hypothetical protein
MGATINCKKILNSEEQALINLVHIQEGFVGGHSDIIKD